MVELDKYLPIDKEYQFRGGVNENFAKIERGFSQRDGIMKNHKTDEKNAHNSGQIKHFLWDVKQHLDYLTAQSANIVRGANGDGIAETVDSRVAAFSKSAHVTLSERLLEDFLHLNNHIANVKNEVDINKEEFNKVEYRFEPELQGFQYLTGLSPFKNAVMQSFHIDYKTSIIYMTQATDLGYRLSRHMLNGQEIDFMLCDGGGHGTHNGYRWIGDTFWVYSHYFNSSGKSTIVRFKYNAGVTQTYGTNGMQDVYTGQDGNPYITPVINEKEGTILYRLEGRKPDGALFNWIEIRSLKDIDNRVNKIIYSVEIPTYLTTETNPMQGVATNDGVLYWYTGNYRLDTPNYLTAFDLSDGKQLYQRKISIGVTGGIVAGDSAEGEGMQFYYDLETGRCALLLGVTIGAGNNRQHEIYGIFQRGVYESLNANSTPVLMGDNGGRRKAMPVNSNLLADVKAIGAYYISTADIKKYVDFPMPHDWFPAGWLFDVDYPNHGGDFKQTLTMNSFSGTPLTFVRMNSFNSAGNWSYIPVYSSDSGIRIPTVINKLSNFNIAGMTAYMTTEDSKRMTDFPRNDGVAGWWIENGMSDTGGGVIQTVRRNADSNVVETYLRTVSKTKISPWSIIRPELA